MAIRFQTIVLAAVLTCVASGPARAQVIRRIGMAGEHASPEEVQQAIDRAQQALFTQQKPDGSFERAGVVVAAGQVRGQMGQYGGETALATYALLASGLSSNEPHVAKAVKFLKSNDVDGTYALGLRSQVWYQLSLELDPNERTPSKERVELQRYVDHDARALMRGMNTAGAASGMYTYSVNNARGAFDHSCSNYGAMGLWACAQVGFDVPRPTWAAIQKGWQSHQSPGAGWGYTVLNGGAGAGVGCTPTMTSGGLVNLYITQEFLDENGSAAADCHGNVRDPNVDTAIDWLGQNLSNGRMNGGYLLFNVQRVGNESGLVQFGDVDWYSTGADALVRQNVMNVDVVNTAFHLAFLALGRAPVVMSKLQYADPAGREKFGHWAQRPRDAANATRWIEKQLHQRLNWQVVTLAMPMDVLHRSPMLYVSGNQRLSFTADEQAKLKRYVLEGGIIVGNADCGDKNFAASFRELGERLFPDYAFRPLPAKHPLVTDELFPAKAEKHPAAIEGLGNQAREFMLLFANDDAGRAWQLIPQVMQHAQGALPKDELYHAAGNLFYYSTERGQVRDKKKTWILPEQPKATGKVTVARLEYDGNWDPEPFGWRQFANYLRKAQKLEVDLPRVRLGADQLDIAKYKIAYLTGTAPMDLSDRQRAELKRFTYQGGLLIVDAAGGSAEFVESAQRELTIAFGRELELVPAEHPVFSTAAKIDAVAYREKTRKLLGEGMTKPVLKMIQEDGRPRVFFSPLDLAVAMVGQPIDGVNGYQPESAWALMMNMIVYGVQMK